MIGYLLRRQPQVPDDDGWLTPAERSWFTPRRSAKRIADWRLGRWTAKAAVAAYLEGADDPVAATIEILAAEDGAPEAFAAGRRLPVALSLSHRHDLAIAAVAAAGTALGCDLERIEPRSKAFVESYLGAAESDLLDVLDAAERPLWVNLFWSAKESASKALRQGLTTDTRALEVAAEPPSAGSWGRLRVSSPAATFEGRWLRLDEMVLTIVARPAPKRVLALG